MWEIGEKMGLPELQVFGFRFFFSIGHGRGIFPEV